MVPNGARMPGGFLFVERICNLIIFILVFFFYSMFFGLQIPIFRDSRLSARDSQRILQGGSAVAAHHKVGEMQGTVKTPWARALFEDKSASACPTSCVCFSPNSVYTGRVLAVYFMACKGCLANYRGIAYSFWSEQIRTWGSAETLSQVDDVISEIFRCPWKII